MKNFTILKDFIKHVKRFNLRGRTLEFRISSVPKHEDPVKWIRNAINEIILYATAYVKPTDKVGFTFCSQEMKRGMGWKNFIDAGEVTFDSVWEILAGIFQSNSSGFNTDTFCLSVTTVEIPTGTGKRKNKYNTFNEECLMRRGIVTIDNNDNLCLPRALVVAIANVEKDPEYSKVRNDTGKIQTMRAKTLMEDSSLIIPVEGAGIQEIQQLQTHLAGKYKICVYAYGSTKGRDIVFEGTGDGSTLNLLFHQGHYNVITSLTAAFCCGYYCESCHVPYDTKNHHRCQKMCQACLQTPACQAEVKIKCDNCNRWFKNQKCLDNHIKPNSFRKKSVCSEIICCSHCLKTIRTGRVHYCGEVYCKICKKHQPQEHVCFMQRDTSVPITQDFLYLFYDLETRQEKFIDETKVAHEPNLCVLMQCCHVCINDHRLYFCQNCGFKVTIIKNEVIENFMNYVLEARKKHKQVIVIAHNGQSFDHQFVLNHILTKTDLTPDLIMRGTKIISMVIGNVKFLDSLNYFPMALSKLPKTFGLDSQLKKGYFPHLFNTLENANYIGVLPAESYYSPDTMKEAERKVFLAWYNEHKHNEFNMQRELVDYCVSDVNILMQTCLKFREQLLTIGNVCPFTEACTIASACNKVFRRNFLKPDTIGIIPRGGYRYCDNQSKIATQWLIWEEHTRNINILHSAKQKEVRLGGLKIDGFCKNTNQVFEFHGCYYHGHPDCHKYNREKPLSDNPSETLNLRYESTVAKTERLRSLGYEVIEMWGCEFARKLQANKEMQLYTENHPLIMLTPLNPRDAFYGGRTGNTKTYYKAREGEKINYIDVCSLYPFVCKNGKFPIGHPTVFVGEECPKNVHDIDGLIKCRILPPQSLYHPVLPCKMDNKLIFALCRLCAENKNNGECAHSDSERAIMGTWVIDEVVKAIAKGYTLLEVYEIWQYNVEQYNQSKQDGGLFTEMMNKFLKLKQEASGWPRTCLNNDQKDEYVEQFFEQEGIRLDFAEIKENAGLRALAKLILNSFWGKLGQRENQPKTKIVNRPDEFFTMMSDPSIIMNTILPINENTLVVNYEKTEESYDLLSTVNVCLAAYTTAQARLKLYTYLEQLGERVLYYDTDSVIFTTKSGDVDPVLGTSVGQMTNELEGYGPGSYITEFASGGPKNYAYIVYSPETNKYNEVCKVKGICINYEVGKDVNFNTLKEAIMDDNFEPKKIAYTAIRRTETHGVITTTEEKIFRPTSNKRKFIGYDSVPYGYKKPRTD